MCDSDESKKNVKKEPKLKREPVPDEIIGKRPKLKQVIEAKTGNYTKEKEKNNK